MPSASRPKVPQCRKTSWLVCAPRLSPNRTTGARPLPVVQTLQHPGQSSRFCSRARATRPSDSGDGRLEYCRVTDATSPRVRYWAAAMAT